MRTLALGCIAEIATRFISVLLLPPPFLRTLSFITHEQCHVFFFIIKLHNHHPSSSVLLIQVTHITAVLSAVSYCCCCFSHLGKFYLLFFPFHVSSKPSASFTPTRFSESRTPTYPLSSLLSPQTTNKQAKAALVPLRIIPQRRARIMYKNTHHIMPHVATRRVMYH